MDLKNLVAIDVHTHAWKSALQVDDKPTEQQQAMGRYFRYQPQHQTVPEMAAMYRKLKMGFVVFTVDSPKEPRKISNEEIAELAHQHSDVAIPFASIDPHRGEEGVRAARRLIKDYGVKGFKFHPTVQEFFPNDRLAYPLYEVIAEAKLPALFHTGQTGVGAGTPGGGGLRLKYSNPLTLDDVAADFPDMPIILAHPSFPWQEEALVGRDPQAAGLYRPLRLVAEVFPADPGPVCKYATEGQDSLRLGLPGAIPGKVGRGVRQAADQAGSAAEDHEGERGATFAALRPMPVRQEISEGLVPVKVYTGEIEPAARQQLVNISRLPIVHHHVAAMPDVHLGIGATVGSVIPTKSAIIPAAVGVDIGCGMMATRTSLTANELDESSLKKVFNQVTRDVPVGFGQHGDRDARSHAAKAFQKPLQKILGKHGGIGKRIGKNSSWVHQLGTLGGGNHFIEVCLDEENRVWAMLHSGSRGIGNAIGSYFIELAKRDAERTSLALPDKDLAYFPEGAQHFDDYVEAVGWAQDYARANREEMMDLVLDAMRRHLPSFNVTGGAVNCHHNYVEREQHFGERVWVTRKGAIRAGAGELGIIPGQHGHAQLHRARQGLGGQLPFLRARRGPLDEPERGAETFHDRRSGSNRPKASSAARTRA